MTGILHIVVARKPIEGTIAENCLKHGCGSINVDDCRIGPEEITTQGYRNGENGSWLKGGMFADDAIYTPQSHTGRWPANLILDMSTEVQENFPDTKSPATYVRKSLGCSTGVSGLIGIGEQAGKESLNFGDSGSASRFFFNFTEQESNESGDIY